MNDILIYTVHKAGSMFLHGLTIDATQELGIVYNSPNPVGSKRDYDEVRKLTWKGYIEDPTRNGCFGPIRAGIAEPIFPDDIDDYSIILHVRDPRDVLTSLFFSSTYSHPRREGGFNPSDDTRQQWEEEGIDSFVIKQAVEYKERYDSLTSNLIDRQNVILIKYEDMVLNYSLWLEQYLSVYKHIPIPQVNFLRAFRTPKSLESIQRKLYKKYRNDFTPNEEDIHKLKRQITPGDHKRKLSPDTIAQLNVEFAETLSLLGYAID